MILASELAGFVAAHAIWCVSGGDVLVPMLAFATDNGERRLERLAFDDIGAAVENGRKRLEDAPSDVNDGVLAYDGYVPIDGGKLDAIILEMRCYGFPSAQAAFAVRYTPATSGRFRVHKPKLVQWHECDDFDIEAAFEAFFRGVDAHEKGAKLWASALDESK